MTWITDYVFLVYFSGPVILKCLLYTYTRAGRAFNGMIWPSKPLLSRKLTDTSFSAQLEVILHLQIHP